MKKIIGILLILLNLVACGQSSSSKSNKKEMNLSAITNSNVKAAIEALQNGDESWYSYFTENPEMTDDGNDKDFYKFFKGALGKEKFLTIDNV